MNLFLLATIAYGFLSLSGGIFAYTKVKSKMSLISGIISGLLLIVAAVMQWQGSAIGSYLAIIVTIGLIIVFSIRLGRTRKFMPSGLMLIAGVIALSLMVYSWK